MDNDFENTLEPFLTSAFGDRFLFSVNRNLFAKMSADQVYENFFGKGYFKEEHFYLIVGTDSGALINYFLRKGVPEGSRILFVELPDVLERIAEVVDLKNLGPFLAVVDATTLSDKLDAFDLRKYIFADRMVILKALCTKDAFRPDYYELYLKIKTDLQEAIFATRANLGERYFIVKQLENVAESRVSSECLRGKFIGKTAVLLAVGPSLDEAIPWVKKHRESLVVIAVSRAARKLYHAGLPPHIIVTIDPSDASFDMSREMLHFFKDSVFLYGKHSTPLLTGQWRGRKLYMGERFPWETPLNVPTLEFAGPTVTQASLQAAIEMGFARVILAGVDMCFSREGYAYSSDVVGREKGTIVGDIPGGIETNGGWLAGTIFPYLAGARIMERQARLAAAQGCKVINTAAGAMKIEGIEYCPPHQLKIEPPDATAEEIFARSLPESNPSERAAHYHLMEKELIRARKAIVAIGRLADSALQANREMFRAKGVNRPGAYKRKMDRIEETISTKFGDFPRFVKSFGIMRFLRIVQPRSSGWSDELIEKTARLYYEAYKDSIQQLTGLIDRALSRLQSRQSEESANGDFTLLADQWEQDRQFGRCLLWRDRHPATETGLSEKDRKRYTALEKRFQRILSLEENLNTEKAAPKIDLGEIRSQAAAAFRRGQIAGIELLVNSLREHTAPGAENLAHLVQAYLAELSQDWNKAFDLYQKVIDSGQSTLTEDALLRVAALANEQKDYRTFKMALECLAGLSPIYAPKYGDLLWLLEEKERALDVYADYLEKVPGDVRALIQLGRYYLELGSPESARVAYQFALEQDPQNQTAMMLLASLENRT